MYWRLGEPDDVLIKAWKLDNKQIMYLNSFLYIVIAHKVVLANIVMAHRLVLANTLFK